jgi:hypothetical protein
MLDGFDDLADLTQACAGNLLGLAPSWLAAP